MLAVGTVSIELLLHPDDARLLSARIRDLRVTPLSMRTSFEIIPVNTCPAFSWGGSGHVRCTVSSEATGKLIHQNEHYRPLVYAGPFLKAAIPQKIR